MKIYRGCRFFRDRDGVWTVIHGNGTKFIPALDDSKLTGNRKFIRKANTARACREYIDWLNRRNT